MPPETMRDLSCSVRGMILCKLDGGRASVHTDVIIEFIIEFLRGNTEG